MRKVYVSLIIIGILLVLYLLGPSPSRPAYANAPAVALPPVQSQPLTALEETIRVGESQHKLKPGNEAGIIWANDSLKNQTEYAIVYLHGFTASREEGQPVHVNIAKKFGYNLYLSRLAEHGIDTTEELIRLTADNYWNSAVDAFNIGRQLGKKVIIMATSTGGTLALMLAAAYPAEVEGLILLSPNIAINDPTARVLNNPWGLQIARMVQGSKYIDSKDQRDIFKKYWYSHYRIEGAVALEELLETSMTEATFKKVTQPLLMLYYYKDEVHQDSVVSVAAMQKMFEQLGTQAAQKHSVAMPNTGDHVIGSYIKSKDCEGVEREITQFMTGVLRLRERR